MKIATIKIIIGSLGLLGIIMCGSSVVKWTLQLGLPQNYIGAIVIAFLCGCAGFCCIEVLLYYIGVVFHRKK